MLCAQKVVILLALTTIQEVNGATRAKRIVGGRRALLPPEDDPVVYLRYAGRFAKITGIKQDHHYMFRGLRYAQPPTNKDRFQRPRKWYLQGNVDATKYPPPCIQAARGPSGQMNRVVGNEDCLYLNIYSRELPDGSEGLPVILWIHGGGFRTGSASQYGVKNLVDKRIVLVTIQYRLGTFGFLSTGTRDLPGNVGIWDMMLAVEWTRNHIGFFGGNPHRIVVMGQGTGATSALMLSLSNIARGQITGVISMSGTAISHWAVENTPQITADQVADEFGCPTRAPVAMVKCLQNVPAENIIQGDSATEENRLLLRGFTSGLNGVLGSAPVVEGLHDGRSLPCLVENEPLDDMSEGHAPKIPLLIGVTKDETAKAVKSNYRNEIITKLTTVPHYLDQVLLGTLQRFTGLGKEKTNGSSTSKKKSSWTMLNPMQFTNYLRVPKNDITKGLEKIAEATNDALFNLPAYLTADLWSKTGASTFLYRFSHRGNAKKGRFFLGNLPLVGNETSDAEDVVSHGDDLAYLFEAKQLDGSDVDEEVEETEEDRNVRQFYTQLVANFARHGRIVEDHDSNVHSFSSNDNNFIEISNKPKVEKDFRFCEMALWAGLTQRLQSATCKFYQVLEGSMKIGENVFFDTVNVASGKFLNPVGSSKNAELNNMDEKEKTDGKNSAPVQGNIPFKFPISYKNTNKMQSPVNFFGK